MYITGIILSRTATEPRGIVTMKGTRDEVELFILEHMDLMDRCKTKNIETGDFDDELTIVNI